jgi:hypothetical protein
LRSFGKEVRKTGLFPNMAIQQLPESISDSTKKRLYRYSSHEVAELLVAVIDEINHGSVESIEASVMKRITDHK